MKTFSEACQATFIAQAKTEDEALQLEEHFEQESPRWHQLHLDVQLSPEVDALIYGLNVANQAGASIGTLIRAAFSHGVMVGIEMERAEDPLPAESVPGRRDPGSSPGEPPPTEWTSI